MRVQLRSCGPKGPQLRMSVDVELSTLHHVSVVHASLTHQHNRLRAHGTQEGHLEGWWMELT